MDPGQGTVGNERTRVGPTDLQGCPGCNTSADYEKRWHRRCARNTAIPNSGDGNSTYDLENPLSAEDPARWHTKDEVLNLWIDAVNKWLTIDRLLVNKKRYDSRAITKAKVMSTWMGTLRDEKSLPEDRTNQNGVLVGIVPTRRRPRGRHRAPHELE